MSFGVRTFGLAIAWSWEFDHDFVMGIEWECRQRGVTTYRIDPDHLQSVLDHMRHGDLNFYALFDRASDADTAFLPLVHLLQRPDVCIINPHDRVVHAIDKATMHLELITHGIHVPNSIILSPFTSNGKMEIQESDLERIGFPFVIKPANTTGGGTGVVMGAQTLDDVALARRQHADDKYLLQETIIPKMLDGKRAWFRVYCVFDDIIPCWWDDQTHMYTELHPHDEEYYDLAGLRNVMRTIQSACKLDFFSSEIAMTEERKFIVVDYVNEVCDMRLQSKYHNGAPDKVVHHIERLIAEEVHHHLISIGQAQ